MTNSSFGSPLDAQATYSLLGTLGFALAIGPAPNRVNVTYTPFDVSAHQTAAVGSSDSYTEVTGAEVVTDAGILRALTEVHDSLVQESVELDFETKEHISRNIWEHYL